MRTLTVIAAALALLLGGCNTISGIGKDLERGGEKLQDAAERPKN